MFTRGEGRVDDLHLDAGFAVEAFLQRYIVPGELGLRRPLRREDEFLRLGLSAKDKEQAEYQDPDGPSIHRMVVVV